MFWWIAGGFAALYLLTRAATPSTVTVLSPDDTARFLIWMTDYNTAFGTPIALNNAPVLGFTADKGAPSPASVGVMSVANQIAQAWAANRLVLVEPSAAAATTPDKLPRSFKIAAVSTEGTAPQDYLTSRPNMVVLRPS